MVIKTFSPLTLTIYIEREIPSKGRTSPDSQPMRDTCSWKDRLSGECQRSADVAARLVAFVHAHLLSAHHHVGRIFSDCWHFPDLKWAFRWITPKNLFFKKINNFLFKRKSILLGQSIPYLSDLKLWLTRVI